MESTEAIDIPVNTKDAHKHKDRDTDANITKNVQKENPSTIDATAKTGSTFTEKSVSSLTDVPQYANQPNKNSIVECRSSESIDAITNTSLTENKTEIGSNRDCSINLNSDEEISLIKQQPIHRETLKHLQEKRRLEEQKQNFAQFVVGVPRVSTTSANVLKKTKLIFSEVIRWKKVHAVPKQEEGADQDLLSMPQSPQRKRRRKSFKEVDTKSSNSNKRTRLQRKASQTKSYANESIEDEISFGDEAGNSGNNHHLYEYEPSENELTLGKENESYANELDQEEVAVENKNGIIKNNSSWNILDAMEKAHSSKNFHELAAENDDIKAFTTIKDLAERMTKQDVMSYDQTWDQSSEDVDKFALGELKYNDPYDGQDEEATYQELEQESDDFKKSIKSNNKLKKKKVLKKKINKEKEGRKKDVPSSDNTTITPMWPLPPLGDERNQIFSEFTKKGKRRKRLPRRDLRQYLPKINPVLRIEGESPKKSPKTLDDYIVVRSAKAPRKAYTKYNTLDNPELSNRVTTIKEEGDNEEDEKEITQDENEEIDSPAEPDASPIRKTRMKSRASENTTGEGNINDTYDGESQEDIESDEESQEDIEDTTKKKRKKIEGNNNINSEIPPEQYAAMHADRNTYGCMFCNYMAPKKEWLIHLKRKHRDKPLVFCTYVKFCNMPFEFPKDLDAHIEDIHAKHAQSGPRFRDVRSYIEFEGEENNDDKEQKPPKKLEKTAHKCEFCDFSGIKRHWILHLKTKHVDKNLVFCEFSRSCSLPFENQEVLDNHIQSFHLTNICDICGQEFKFRNVLREHKKIHIPEHLDPNGDPDLDTDNCWICTYCGKKYRTRKGCKAHEAFRHDRGKLRHRCNHIDAEGKKCESAFYDPKELQIHQRKHTGELPFICGYCGARYISKATLVQHEKAKHLETENVECEICHKLMRKRNLPAHVKTHEGFVGLPCKLCGKKFSTIGGKNRHEKIHTADKQFECSYCGKAFVQKANMQAHERIHTGEKPYTCKFCGEGFVQGTRRNQHQAGCKMQSTSNFVAVDQQS